MDIDIKFVILNTEICNENKILNNLWEYFKSGFRLNLYEPRIKSDLSSKNIRNCYKMD